MSVSAATLELLTELGVVGADLVRVVRAIEADFAAQDSNVARNANAERQKRFRDRRKAERNVTDNSVSNVTDNAVTSNVTSNVTPPSPPSPKEKSPTPPKEITPSSPPRVSSGAIAPSDTLRTPPENPPTFRETVEHEFATIFWPAYPRKDGKKPAREAFFRQRGKVDLETIMAGLGRYKAKIEADPRADMSFVCHAATFLNQERFNDEHAAQPPRGAGRRDGSILATLAEIVEEREAQDRGQGGADAGSFGNGGPADGDAAAGDWPEIDAVVERDAP